MTNNTVDPWLETLTAGGGIEGVHLKYAKGIWYLDGVQISVGEIGLKIAVLMSTAAHNAVLWDNQEIIERTPLRRYEDAAPSFDIEKGWSPYTQFLGVGADEKHLGQLVTYTSSAWSGRHAFRGLIGPYLRKGKREFPIVTLGSKPRPRDPNGNIDPTFAVVDWAPRANFADMLPEAGELAALTASSPTAARLPPPSTVTSGRPTPEAAPVRDFAPLDDEIPF
jgi:hypothetical protein